MDWRSHMLIGGGSALAGLYLVGSRDIMELIVLTVFGALSALIPDLDHDASKGRRLLDLVFIIFAFSIGYSTVCGTKICIPEMPAILVGILTFLALVGLYFIIFRFFKPRHRGITHTLIACLLFGGAIYLLAGLAFAIAGLAGYLSHLLADKHIKVV